MCPICVQNLKTVASIHSDSKRMKEDPKRKNVVIWSYSKSSAKVDRTYKAYFIYTIKSYAKYTINDKKE